MSINLGTKGTNAALALAGNEPFHYFVEALEEQMSKFANTAMDAPPDMQMQMLGYARGLRDLWIAVEAARSGKHQGTIKAAIKAKE